jgi:hypothetical protein
MSGFTRSVVWRFWTAVLLLSVMLVHPVRAVKMEDREDYNECLANPADCLELCVSLPLP